MEKELESPYKIMYYVHDIYSNIDSYPKIKYEQILLKEEAITRAKNLLKQLKNYFYKIQKEYTYDITTMVINYQNELVEEFK